MKTLKAITHRDEHSRLFETKAISYLDEVIFTPLKNLTGDETRENAEKEKSDRNALLHALAVGAIWYADGVFTGAFNAAVSRELRSMGAKSREAGASFVIEQSQIPYEIRSAVTASKMLGEKMHKEVLGLLDQMQENLPLATTGIAVAAEADKLLADLQIQFVDSAKKVKDVDVTPTSETLAGTIRTGLTEGIELGVRDLSQRIIQSTRRAVKKNLEEGGRVDRLILLIALQRGLAKLRVQTLAESEAAAAISTFREERYTEIGLNRYIWSTVGDERVRHDHRALDTQVFSWSSPPIVDRASGRRGHPGDDYNCRCVAIPLVSE